jgi:hypothetical protein
MATRNWYISHIQKMPTHTATLRKFSYYVTSGHQLIYRTSTRVVWSIGSAIIFARCRSLSAHESESMLWTYLVCRNKQERERERERERETSKRHVGVAHSALIRAVLIPQRLSCYWGKLVSLRMLTSLRLADLHLAIAQQRSTGQNIQMRFGSETQLVTISGAVLRHVSTVCQCRKARHESFLANSYCHNNYMQSKC